MCSKIISIVATLQCPLTPSTVVIGGTYHLDSSHAAGEDNLSYAPILSVPWSVPRSNTLHVEVDQIKMLADRFLDHAPIQLSIAVV